ncbi:peroxisomal membrane protein 11C isoform X1 [Equus asinus]|uniref:peroxisomal membrane protein 11C isoform X1 n=1 Tax=Equus asinus TaxID=9793 RepID=UPI0038F76345
MKRACFVSLHQGHRAALSRVGVLRNYLCHVGEHQGLAVTAGPAPSNSEASCEPRPAPVSFSKVKLSPKRTLPGDAGRAGQRLQSPLLYLGVWNRVGAQRNALCCYKAGGSSTGSREGIQLLTQQQPLKPEAPCPLQAFRSERWGTAASWSAGSWCNNVRPGQKWGRACWRCPPSSATAGLSFDSSMTRPCLSTLNRGRHLCPLRVCPGQPGRPALLPVRARRLGRRRQDPPRGLCPVVDTEHSLLGPLPAPGDCQVPVDGPEAETEAEGPHGALRQPDAPEQAEGPGGSGPV